MADTTLDDIKLENTDSENEDIDNYSEELSVTDQDDILSYDYIYPSHSGSQDHSHFEEEIELVSNCLADEEKEIIDSPNPDIHRLQEILEIYKKQSQQLRELTVYHLDLIQEQNEQISLLEKSQQALKEENDTLKAELIRRYIKLCQTIETPIKSEPS